MIIKNNNKNHIDKIPLKNDLKEQWLTPIKIIKIIKYKSEKISDVDHVENGIKIIIINAINNKILFLASRRWIKES